ncbi:MAG: porin [Gammaproteobacteria bacterium]|jgi:hypothetical protein|nr:porin [Gammaproteobacteria bacterium]
MNKRLLVLAVAGAFGAAGAASASAHSVGEVDLSIGGHVETGFYVTDDATEGTPDSREQRFNTEGELSFRATVNDNAYVRADIDINSRYSDTDETIEIEQLYGALRINDMAKVRVGRFTNPLGYESIDAPHKTTYSRSVIIDLLDDQTGLYQNTIEGVAVDLDLGPAKLTLGVLNEIGDTDEENSFLAHVSGEALPGLKLALGVLTQEDIDDSANNTFENLINFNAAYNIDLGAVNTTFFVDYLTAGEDLDNAYSLGAKAMFTDTIGATLRYDMAEYDNDDEETALTLGVNWAAAQSVDIRAEWRNDEFEANGAKVSDDDSVILSAVFSF